MKHSSFQKQLSASPSSRMALKLSSLTILLVLCYSMVSTFFVIDKVSIPDGCARSCPPQRDPSRFICARSRNSRQLGMFDSECFFGRYNNCVFVNQSELKEN